MSCPITDIKIVERTAIDKNDIKPYFPRNSSDKYWHYIDFDEKYVLGISTLEEQDPVVSFGVTEKQPCMNIDLMEMATNNNKRYILDGFQLSE